MLSLIHIYLIADSTYGQNDIQHFDLSIPSDTLAASNTLKFEHRLTGTSDLFGTAYYRVEYPRDWNFSSLNYFKFGLEASTCLLYTSRCV